MNFSELKLTTPLLRAVDEAGYTTPSPIQEKAIPPVLKGYDLLGCAQTGTGKTAAFALPILQQLAAKRPHHKKIRALILTPTRELALQIDESFAAYGKYLTLTHAVIFGGVGQAPQVAALKRGVDIVTACPGRLNDLIGQGFVDLSALEIFVLDEADRMLDMGFVHDVKKVIAKLPRQRQTLFFSATMPHEIEALADSILHDPVSVKVDPVSSPVEKIDQRLYYVSKADKRPLLASLVGQPQVRSALVFSRTKHGADKIARDLTKAGIPAAAIHGNKSQNARVAALENFKAGKVKALVATDIAARGIDINDLSHVFNYDLPEVPETYVHRIGRTARAGAEGVAISFCSPEEREYLAGIEKLNRKKIPLVREHPWAQSGQETPRTAPVQRTARPKRPAQAAAMPRPARQEKTTMEQNNQNGAVQPGTPGTGRRRRRRRRGSSGTAQGAAQPMSVSGQNRPRPAAERTPQPQSAKRPEPTRTQRSQKAAPVKPAAEEDAGLLLISRKPPQQKFTSFEDYMNSHADMGDAEK